MPEHLPRDHFPAGTTVFRYGEQGSSAYLIERGQVEILAGDGQARITILEAGAMFGEVALLDQQPRTATVRALGDTVLVRIDRAHIEEILRHTDPVIRHFLAVLLKRFRSLSNALYPANELGLNPAKDQEAAVRSLILTRDLAHALDVDQLELFYQPLIHFGQRQVVGFEALVRWRHPTLGMIMPLEFIELAERTGLVHRLGNWVLRRAIRDWPQLAPLCQTEAHPNFVSINLSADELANPALCQIVEQNLAAGGMPAKALKIELTETAIIEDLAAVRGVLHGLAALGVTIALDDFGTGYGGLDTLKALPISCLKIDKTFVQEMFTSPRSHEIVHTALQLAHSLTLSTIAEGIEDIATADHLQALGCDIAQGYHFARPMPLADLPGWLAQAKQAGTLHD